ncbi:MAG: ATP phosphoribosyltransferase regulatory subunit [Planctomycetota bacterium]|jgi:histidyl-tRNA synthetase
MKIPPVKGTRDFYPPQMAIRNFIVDGWKAASLRNGFEEYDGPIFEYLKMFDRGGRELAIRPEITPTLARMVNQQINSLPRPIKWFSVPRLCRAERPQKGRLREFFQWNIDIIGVDDVLADAEVIFTTVDYLRSVELGPRDIRVKISSRKLLDASLINIGIPKNQLASLYTMLDKFTKIPTETFEKMLAEQVPDRSMAKKIMDFMNVTSIVEVTEIVGTNAKVEVAIQELARLKDILGAMGVWQYCEFYPSIVRGLAYYTGVVFEVHEFGQRLRAICGGGRFDNLLHDFGGPQIPATGMGMGDCVLEILLEENGLLDKLVTHKQLDYFVACIGEKPHTHVDIQILAKLRSLGFSAEFSYKKLKLKKLLKQAGELNAKKCIIIGEEFKDSKLVVKDMASGTQEMIDIEKFFEKLKT